MSNILKEGTASIREKLVTGSAWATLGQFVTMVMGFASSFILARMMSVGDMGTYFLVFNFVAVITTVFSLGLPTTIVRRVSQYIGLGKPGVARQVVIVCMLVTGVLGAISYGLILMFGGWFAEHMYGSLALAVFMPQLGFLAFIALMRSLVAETYRGLHDLRSATIFGGMTTSLLSAIGLALLWWMNGASNMHQVLWISMGSSGLVMLIAWFNISRTIFNMNVGSDYKSISTPAVLKDVFSISWDMWAISVVMFLIINTDLWVVSFFGTEEDVAIYGIASRLTILVTLFHGISTAVVQSIISELHAQGNLQSLEKVVRTVGTVNFLQAFLVAIVFLFFAKDLLGLAFGSYYMHANQVLIILSFAHLVGMVFGPIEMLLMMSGFQREFLYISIFTELVSLVLKIIFMKNYGVEGVAYAMLFGGVIYSLVVWLFLKHSVKIKCHVSLDIIFNLFGKNGLINELILMKKT